jgi:hypothetical protein
VLQFDTLALFERAGGPAALRRALAEDNHGFAPAEATVAMWKSRSRISQTWMASCIFAVLSRDPEFTLTDILVTTPDDPGDLFS